MKRFRLRTLKFWALLFLLPGLAGLVASAVVSTRYLESLPRTPAPEELRMVPRNIHGTLVYQTEAEDRRLTVMEDVSVGIFLVGLILGLVYLERWGNVRSTELELDEEELSPLNSK